jgi:UDP-glucose 4-epimerase
MANILVTGAAGFIGSSFAKKLHTKGHNLVLIDNLSFGNQDNFVDAPELFQKMNFHDIRSSESKSLYENIDIVYHFAGISSLPECQANPLESFSVNSAGTANVFEYSRLHKVKKVVVASTAAVYENNSGGVHTENEEVDPFLIYSLSKKHAEDIAKSYGKVYGMDFVICRFFNVYGPHQDYQRPNPPFTSYLVKELLAGNVPTIFNVLDDKRDYIFIEDLMIYLEALIEKSFFNLPPVINFASGNSYSPLEIFQMLCEILEVKGEYALGASKYFWAKYTTLDQGFAISDSILQKEIHKNAVSTADSVKEFLSGHQTIGLEHGLRSIVAFQKNLNLWSS